MCYCQFLLLCLLVFVLCMEVFLHWVHAAAAKSLQSCPTLCDPIDGNPPGSSVPGILEARILEWVAISSSNAWKWKVKVKSLSRVRLFATPWTAAHQAPPSMGFSRQEYWSGVPVLRPPFFGYFSGFVFPNSLNTINWMISPLIKVPSGMKLFMDSLFCPIFNLTVHMPCVQFCTTFYNYLWL